ncbi:MAG: hypothetical protein ACT4OS_08890 [Acidimicrobiales bacterium]
MAKVDESGQPLSDAPEGPDDLRGGKVLGDPALDDASANGTGAGHSGAEYDTTSPQLPGERGSGV